MQLNRLYDCKHCTEGFVGALEHWKDQCFSTDDDYAHEVVQMFDDKIHEVKLKLEKLELRKTKLKTYKFWNPEHVDHYLELTQRAPIDSQTCTAAELAKVETDGKLSTDILLVDDKQADAIVQVFVNESFCAELRYEEIKGDV
jgi:valyl-tRNA synthetase